MEELISVIVSVYNSEQTLAHTLRCIADQTYSNLEIILVDDGSTDSSGMICDAFAERDSRCKVIHKQNGGQGSAKNAGQAIASGAYLFFPDSDDTFNLDMIRILHQAISMRPDYDIAISGRRIVKDWDTDTTPPDCAYKEIKTVEYCGDDLVQSLFGKHNECFVYGWNKLYKRRLIDGLWWGNYARHQDFDFNYRAFLRTKAAIFVDMPLYYWVHWNASKIHSPDTWDIYYNCRAAILFSNWIQLTSDSIKYEHFLLDALYRSMVFWEEWSRKSGDLQKVKTICKDYRKKTTRAYLHNNDISFFIKIVCLTLLSIPGLSHLVMKLTSNVR